MPQPAEVRALTAQLIALYADLWQRITETETALLTDWPALSRAARQQRLGALGALALDLTTTADEQALRWTVSDLPRAYLLGAVAITSTQGLAGIDLDALSVLASDTYADLLAATRGVSSSTKTLIRTLARQHLSDKLIAGETAQQAGKDLAAELEQFGIRAVTYANGTRHGLADYTDMLLRTKSAQAYSTGNLRGAAAAGVGWVEVFDGTGCGWTSHDDTDKANGTLRSVDEAMTQVISHPRCQRSFGSRPDITSPEQAAGARPSTTAAQRTDQAAVDRSRELAVAQRAAARALAKQVDRRAQAILSDELSRVVNPVYARRLAARQVRMSRENRLAARTRRLQGPPAPPGA